MAVHWAHVNLLAQGPGGYSVRLAWVADPTNRVPVLVCEGTATSLGARVAAGNANPPTESSASPVQCALTLAPARAVGGAPHPPALSSDAACTLATNATRQLLIITHHSHVAVVQLPPIELLSSLAPSAVHEYSSLFRPSSAGERVVSAWFHPLADTCVCVMTSRGTLVLLDAAAPRSAPLRTLHVSHPSRALCNVARACPGDMRVWESMCVFVLWDDASVAYVCPLLPPGALLPRVDWDELLRDAKYAAVGGGSVAESSVAVAVDASLTCAWLHTCWEDVTGQPQWKRYRGAASDTRFAASVRAKTSPCLQGPVSTVPSIQECVDAEQFAVACDITTLPAAATEFSTLAVLMTTGKVVFLASSDPITPSWARAATSLDGAEQCQVCAPGAALGHAFLSSAAASHRTSPLKPPSGAQLKRLAPGMRAEDSSDSAEGSTPWLVLDAVDMCFGSPVELAQLSIHDNGAAFPGGAVGEGLVASDADALASPDEAASVVFVPGLYRDAYRADRLYIHGWNTLVVLQCSWLPASRSLLAGDADSSDAASVAGNTLVYCAIDDLSSDVVGLTVDPSGDSHTVSCWTLPTRSPAKASVPAPRRNRSAVLHPPRTAEASRVEVHGTLQSFPIVAAMLDAAGRPAEHGQTTSVLQSPYASLPSFAERVVRMQKDMEDITRGSYPVPATSSATPLDEMQRSVSVIAERAAIVGELRAEAQARATVLVDSAKHVEAELSRVQRSIADTDELTAVCSKRLQKCQDASEGFRERLENLLQVLAFCNQRLTRAEIEYHEDTRIVHASVLPSLEAHVRQLQEQLAEVTAASAPAAFPVQYASVEGFSELTASVDALRATVGGSSDTLAGVRVQVAALTGLQP